MINYLTSLLGSRLKLFALAGMLAVAVLFSGAYYLRGQALDRCTASIEQIKAIGDNATQLALDAAKRTQKNLEDAERRRVRTLREINANDTNTALSPAVAHGLGLLCSQGAAGCAAREPN